MRTINNKKVLLALSGGIDSAVSVYILQSQGYEVIGINFSFWKWEEESYLSSITNNLLKDISEKFSIDIIQIDKRDYFYKEIIEKFFNEVEQGLTPNPCVFCNPNVKFKLLLQVADEHGMDKIATGHYARVTYEKDVNRYYLRKRPAEHKDQSYMLCFLSQEILSRTVFPLGDKTKNFIFKIGKKFNLQSAEQKESQDLCFVKPENYHAFLINDGLNNSEGNIVNSSGKILGKHNGLFHYTIGQRKGIKVFSSKPYYVIDKNLEKNELIIGSLDELDIVSFYINNPNWICEKPEFPLDSSVRIRYRSNLIPCKINSMQNGKQLVTLEYSARGITPGQYAVFYNNDIVLGGGKIIK